MCCLKLSLLIFEKISTVFHFHLITSASAVNPTTVAPSPVAAMPSKPIVTTAPSQQQHHHQQQNPSGTLPPLKQKTGIVKSKVPPPVPPRGSPKDRRGHRGASPKGTPSSGSYNHLNDKYFDACDRKSSNYYDKHRFTMLTNDSDEKPPTFGDRRSPSCVEDWLELNNFDVLPPVMPVDSPPKIITEHKRPISITTKFLQRERSFHSIGRSSSSSASVQSMNNSYAKPTQLTLPNNSVAIKSLGCVRPTAINVKSSLENIRRHLETRRTSSPNAMTQEIADLRRNSNVSKLLSNYGKQENIQKKIEIRPKITLAIKKHSAAPPLPFNNDPAKNVLASLRPARRKKRLAPRAEDIYCNSKEKQKILISLSNIELRSTDENYDTVIDSFSLEGEFV